MSICPVNVCGSSAVMDRIASERMLACTKERILICCVCVCVCFGAIVLLMVKGPRGGGGRRRRRRSTDTGAAMNDDGRKSPVKLSVVTTPYLSIQADSISNHDQNLIVD